MATTDEMIAAAWPALPSSGQAVLARMLILGALRSAWPGAGIDSAGAVCPTTDDEDPDGIVYVEVMSYPTIGAWVHHPSLTCDMEPPGRAWVPIAGNCPASLAQAVADLLAPFAGQPIPRTSDDGGES